MTGTTSFDDFSAKYDAMADTKNEDDPKTILAISVTIFIVGICVALAICCLRRKISIAVAVIKVNNIFFSNYFKATASFIEDNATVICIPIVFFFFCILMFFAWLMVAMYLYRYVKFYKFIFYKVVELLLQQNINYLLLNLSSMTLLKISDISTFSVCYGGLPF